MSSSSFAPASMIQRQFWTIHQIHPESPAYNIPFVAELYGQLDRKALESSLNETISAHDIFRTSFLHQGDALVQCIDDKTSITLTSEDITELDAARQHSELERILNRDILSPFDLQNGPLIRVCLVRCRSDKTILAIVMHHIITDLRSKELLLDEISRRYNHKTGTAAAIPDKKKSNQYADYARRQEQWLSTTAAEKMTGFWHDRLKHCSSTLNMPTDFPRPTVAALTGDIQDVVIGAAETSTIKDFSRKISADVYLILFAAYLVLLKRYTDQKDIVIGVPLTNRRHDPDKETIGCYVNILPLAFDMSENPSVSTVIRQVRLNMLHAHRHQEVPFERIVDKLRPRRDASYNPIFQVGFTYEPDFNLDLNCIDSMPVRMHNRGSQIDLFLTINKIEDEITGSFTFDSSLFENATIERLRDHYINILLAMIENPDSPVDALPILSAAETGRIKNEWNATASPYPGVCLHQLIERQTEITPENIAVVYDNESLTYKSLNDRANQVAHYLKNQGVGIEDLVGVYIDRSLEMLVAIMGVLKAGAAYVPMDIEFPAHRISQMVEDALPKVILTRSQLAVGLPACSAHVVCLDTDWEHIAKCDGMNPRSEVSPENLAYVIFTSGSTGRPKGVMVPHRAVVNFMESMRKTPGMSEHDTLTAVTTLSFDISVLELFLPLTVGAKIVVADSETTKNGHSLLSLVTSSKTTVMQATPTTYHLMIAAGWTSPLPIKILCGGESFPVELARKLTTLGDSVWNMYGPTETTIWSTCHQIVNDGPVLIGRPIANTKIYIVNRRNQPTPVGVAGELLIGGAGVTRGYLNRPEITAKQFIPDIFDPSSEFSVYRTGDLACYMPSGEIKVLGRIDHQIKLRGFRIELGEIESALESHPAVRQAVVKTHEFEPGDKRCVAYITLKGQHEKISFRDYLKDLLPDYMIPSIFTVLPEMPLTPNNKVDRKALPEPDRLRPELQKELILPQNQVQDAIARVWKDVLRIDAVGIDDAFFDLGGDSLLSIRVITELENTLNMRIPIVKFYQYPTVRLLSDFLKRDERTVSSEKPTMDRAALRRRALKQRRKKMKYSSDSASP